jgi:glycosyltransferase 2 family protein
MKKLFFLALCFVSAAIVVISFAELENIGEVLARGNWAWLTLALGVQLMWLVSEGLTLKWLYGIFGLKDSLRRLTFIVASTYFLNIVAPAAGISGIAMLVQQGRKRGHPGAKLTVIGALYLFLDYAAFLLMLALGLIVLFRRDDLGAGEIGASLIMLGVASGLGMVLYLGAKSEKLLGDFLSVMARWVNRILHPFIKRAFLNEGRARTFAAEMSEGLATIKGKPGLLLAPFLLSIVTKALLALVLMLVFLAFAIPFSSGTIIGGFAVAYLFLVVSPTPSGIGVVEGILPLMLTSLRVRWEAAVIVTLAYRAITFWVPLGVGALTFQALQREK